MKLVATMFTIASWLVVVCRRVQVIKPHRDVTTAQGTVRGYLTPTHAAYLGIPYAESPTQGSRFKAPEPPPSWDGIFEASHKLKCPQLEEDGDENCLVINVFAPRKDTLLPVYVIVHDGDFKRGWGAYDPPQRLLKDGFVVVTFNYRLGALGFLSLKIPDVLGNAGLKDQMAAFYWIQRNIEYFGGNPHEVIAHGVGSGAVSIQLLLSSGLVDEMIHQVIVESGSVLSPSTMTYDPIALAYEGAVAIGYQGQFEVDELYKFYEGASWQDLVNIPITFQPCLEDTAQVNRFVNFDPITQLTEGNYSKVPIIITYTDTFVETIPENISEMMPNNLAFNNRIVEEKVKLIVKEFYLGTGIQNKEALEQIHLEYKYDVMYEYPIVNWAMLYAGVGPHMVYLMKFIQDTETGVNDPAETTYGTILNCLYQDTVEEFLVKLLTMWRNFIAMGDPTPIITSSILIIWQPVVRDKSNIKAILDVPTLEFGKTTFRVTPPPRNIKLQFWDNIYDKFYRLHTTTEDLDDND